MCVSCVWHSFYFRVRVLCVFVLNFVCVCLLCFVFCLYRVCFYRCTSAGETTGAGSSVSDMCKPSATTRTRWATTCPTLTSGWGVRRLDLPSARATPALFSRAMVALGELPVVMPYLFFCFCFFPIPFSVFALSNSLILQLPPCHISDRGDTAGLSPSHNRARLFFYREKSSAFSSLVDSR